MSYLVHKQKQSVILHMLYIINHRHLILTGQQKNEQDQAWSTLIHLQFCKAKGLFRIGNYPYSVQRSTYLYLPGSKNSEQHGSVVCLRPCCLFGDTKSTLLTSHFSPSKVQHDYPQGFTFVLQKQIQRFLYKANKH